MDPRTNPDSSKPSFLPIDTGIRVRLEAAGLHRKHTKKKSPAVLNLASNHYRHGLFIEP